MKIFLYYILIINLYGIYLMYIDKRKSKRGLWRVPESTLFLISSLLGSIGIWSGMYLFRHKTKHKKFTIGIPAILFFQIYIIFKYFYKYITLII